jgi:hypothetical protein
MARRHAKPTRTIGGDDSVSPGPVTLAIYRAEASGAISRRM